MKTKADFTVAIKQCRSLINLQAIGVKVVDSTDLSTDDKALLMDELMNRSEQIERLTR